MIGAIKIDRVRVWAFLPIRVDAGAFVLMDAAGFAQAAVGIDR